MKYFIVGDVHGCFHTYQHLVETYWDPKKETLIQLGDIVNKGKNTFQTIAYSMELSKMYPKNFIQLKGNNEHMFYEQFDKRKLSKLALKYLSERNIAIDEMLDWMRNLPHFWETPNFLVCHAGVAKNNPYPVSPDNLSIIYTREALKNIGKMQFIGHILVESPTYDKKNNIWFLDTDAGTGKRLSAVKVKTNGVVKDIISIKVKTKDLVKDAKP